MSEAMFDGAGRERLAPVVALERRRRRPRVRLRIPGPLSRAGIAFAFGVAAAAAVAGIGLLASAAAGHATVVLPVVIVLAAVLAWPAAGRGLAPPRNAQSRAAARVIPHPAARRAAMQPDRG